MTREFCAEFTLDTLGRYDPSEGVSGDQSLPRADADCHLGMAKHDGRIRRTHKADPGIRTQARCSSECFIIKCSPDNHFYP
jgi:hypothetical protein